MSLHPYLFFNGRCEQAIDFYCTALGAEVALLMRFSESPDPVPEGVAPPDWGHKVMHAEVRLGDARLMMSDGCTTGESATEGGFALSFEATDPDHAARLFNALADQGQVQMPLGRTFWSPCFGVLVDRFGVRWMVGVNE